MFTKGDIFDNPVTGERATILLGTRETRGERLVVELELRGAGFALHVDPIAAMRGYKGSYSAYVFRSPLKRVEHEAKTSMLEQHGRC